MSSNYLDIMGNNADVFEVQRGVNLVHHVERGGFVVM